MNEIVDFYLKICYNIYRKLKKNCSLKIKF